MFLQTAFESLLNQFTSWLGQTEGCIALGASGLVLLTIVGYLGKQAITWAVQRLQGNHLPVRPLVTQVLSTTGDERLWEKHDDMTVANKESSLVLGRGFMRIGAKGDNLFASFNRHERRLLTQARLITLRQIDKLAEEARERAAEDLLKGAVGRLTTPGRVVTGMQMATLHNDVPKSQLRPGELDKLPSVGPDINPISRTCGKKT